MRSLFPFVVLPTLLACADRGADDADVDAWCASSHEATTPDGHDVVVCDEAYDAAPYVAIPADRSLAVLHADAAFRSADGNGLGTLDWQTSELEAIRHGFALYEVTPDAAGGVASFAPVVLVDERRMLAPWLEAPLEGAVSARSVEADGTEEWALTPTLPIRLEVEEVRASEDTSLAPGTLRYEIVYRVANLDAAVRASDGSCLPSLRSHAEADAFHGATDVRVLGSRAPSMHGFGDDAMVFAYVVDGTSRGSVMGANWYVGADAAWSELPAPSPYDGMGHGTPGSMPEIALSLVDGGGGACDPSEARR